METDELTWQAKHERACMKSGITALEERSRKSLTLIGPKAALDQPFAVRHCPKCTPPPEYFKCPMCDWECEDRWRYELHMTTNPKWCRDRAAKKARLWARQV